MGRSNPPIFLPPHLASLGSQFHPPLFPHLKGKYNEYKFHFFKRKFPPKQTSNFTRDKIDYFVFLIFVTFRSSINLFWFKKKTHAIDIVKRVLLLPLYRFSRKGGWCHNLKTSTRKSHLSSNFPFFSLGHNAIKFLHIE